MTKDEAMKLALEALNSYHGYMEPLTTIFGGPRVPIERSTTGKVEQAITALREALAEQPAQYRSTGWAAHRDQYAVPVLFSPYTGEPRDVRDVQSDPQGILIVPPGKVEMRAAKQTHHTEQHLEMVQPAQPQQEPVQRYSPDGEGRMEIDSLGAWVKFTFPTAQRTWVGLTDEERDDLLGNYITAEGRARAIEAKLKEKNT